MESRAAQLRDRHRRIFGWSLFAAVVLHVAVFVLSPTFRTELLDGPDAELRTTDASTEVPFFVDLLFGPPTISAPDGSLWTEPPDRVLQADHGVRLPAGCTELEGMPLHGTVRLRVRASGRVDRATLTESTGSRCGDEVVAMVATDLWYQWLPNDRFPAPVELTQPVTVTEARD